MGALENLQDSFDNLARTMNAILDKYPQMVKYAAKKYRAMLRAQKHSRENNKTVKIIPHGRQYKVRRIRKN